VYDAAVQAAKDKGDPAPAPIFVADGTFTEAWSADLGDERITATTYTPAHTSGDAIVFFEKANVVHVGDLVFNRLHPFIDGPAGASVTNWIRMVEQVAWDHPSDTIYIFGHAGGKFPVTGSRADLMVMRDYLTALITYVSAQIAAGKSRDVIVASTDVLKGFEDCGPLIARALTSTYDELTRK
jgi:glyoxylase-like metal-dependent hydrolase (beta-lactamase superfamily II)